MDVTGKGTAWQKLTNVSEDHIVDDLPPRLLTLIPYPHRITVEFLYIDQF